MRLYLRFPGLPNCCHFSLPSGTSVVRVVILVVLLFAALVWILVFVESQKPHDGEMHSEFLLDYSHGEATDVNDPNLFFGMVVDAGSSGTRVFLYFWPRHNGKPTELLHIQQLRSKDTKPVVKKIKPGISSIAGDPSKAIGYLKPLLDFAASYIPANKHQETPLYILATAGMRMLSQSVQDAILANLRQEIPLRYNFLFSETHAEVISGKQEGLYAWIGINYVLGSFTHTHREDPARVQLPRPQAKHISRKQTVGMLDMGGGSAQIAFEVPMTSDPPGEEVKSMMADINLGCDVHQTEHEYRVYVTTFLGFGGNAARSRYEKLVIRNLTRSQSVMGREQNYPVIDPCLPTELTDEVKVEGGQHWYFKGSGDYRACWAASEQLLNRSRPCPRPPCSLNGVHQPPIDFANSQFYGFSEFWYSMEDVLRMGGFYDHHKFQKAAKEFCSKRWPVLENFHKRGLYPLADEHRFKYQCFKSAWITAVLHQGFGFPLDYPNFRTASLIHDREVQWTLGAILYRTRFLPLRDMQEGSFKSYKPPWVQGRASAILHNQYLLTLCFLVVAAAILIYICRLRRMGNGRMHRVPTMTFYMTEEGQIQDGVTLQNQLDF